MKTNEELRTSLRAIDRRSYPAYKSLAGNWSFGKYILNIEHVQGDPFAAPSQLSVTVDSRTAGFPTACWEASWNRTAWRITCSGALVVRRGGSSAWPGLREERGAGSDHSRPGDTGADGL